MPRITTKYALIEKNEEGNSLLDKILEVPQWAWRSWPIIIPLALFGIHLTLIFKFGFQTKNTNETISLITSIFGGLIILWSIDSTIGIIKGGSISSMVISYLKELPIIRKDIKVKATGQSMSCNTGDVGIGTGHLNPQTIEEKIKYLQIQITSIKNDLEKQAKDLNEKISTLSKETNTRIREIELLLKNVETKVEKVTFGNIKTQLLGVMLLIYGAISGYLAQVIF